MRDDQLLNLNDCSEFRQRLEGRTPPFIQWMLLLLTALLTLALVWACTTRASLVVLANGRVRPTETPNKVYSAVSTFIEGRVAEARVKEGDRVRQGDVLLRLDTQQIDNEIGKLEGSIQAVAAELEKLHDVQSLLRAQRKTAVARAMAELNHARAQNDRQQSKRTSDIRHAEAALAQAKDNAERVRQLVDRGVSTDASWIEADSQLRQAEEMLRQAQLPLDDGTVLVYERELEFVKREFELKQAELAARMATRVGEMEAAQRELAKRTYERSHAELIAPIDGVVVSGNVKVGDLISPGLPVLEIASQDALRFEALVKSEDVGHLHLGMTTRIKLDAYDFQKYGAVQGRVCYVAPDSHVAEPSAGSPAASYLVKIELDENHVGRGELLGKVKLGMAGQAEIVTGRENLLAIFTRQIRQSIRIE